jgi:hypothetical protein
MRYRIFNGLFILLFISFQQLKASNSSNLFQVRELSIASDSSEQMHWFKGNTHCHTMNTDGNSTPGEVVSWYLKHGYNFLVITDGNSLTKTDSLNIIFGKRGQFLVIPGEEVLDHFGEKALDVVAIDINNLVNPQHGRSVHETIQNNVEAVRHSGGIAQVCHPNYTHSILISDLHGLEQVKLLEVYNANPWVNSIGAGGLIPVEHLWDQALTAGQLFYAVAVDDSHKYTGEFSPSFSNPGRGWIMVQAHELTPTAIREALEYGRFYASSGVSLSEYQTTESEISLKINPEQGMSYTTEFIGENGRILATSFDLASKYRFTGHEKYVRVRIMDSKSTFAWTQPVFLNKRINSK